LPSCGAPAPLPPWLAPARACLRVIIHARGACGLPWPCPRQGRLSALDHVCSWGAESPGASQERRAPRACAGVLARQRLARLAMTGPALASPAKERTPGRASARAQGRRRTSLPAPESVPSGGLAFASPPSGLRKETGRLDDFVDACATPARLPSAPPTLAWARHNIARCQSDACTAPCWSPSWPTKARRTGGAGAGAGGACAGAAGASLSAGSSKGLMGAAASPDGTKRSAARRAEGPRRSAPRGAPAPAAPDAPAARRCGDPTGGSCAAPPPAWLSAPLGGHTPYA